MSSPWSSNKYYRVLVMDSRESKRRRSSSSATSTRRIRKASGSCYISLLLLLSLFYIRVVTTLLKSRPVTPYYELISATIGQPIPNGNDIIIPNTSEAASKKGVNTFPIFAHPHSGARFLNGSYGLVVDPNASKFRPEQKLNQKHSVKCEVDEVIEELTFEVFCRIRRGIIRAKMYLKQQRWQLLSTTQLSEQSLPRLLCMVYTHANNHGRVRAILDTWGKDCDGFFAASNFTDLDINTIDLPHQGPEAYSNMWQKVRSIWGYAYDHFLEDYDYFHISGDDSYVVVDNMKAYLMGEQVSRLLKGHIDILSRLFYSSTKRWETIEAGQERPLLLGAPHPFRHSIFPIGGPGYTLNREAVRLLVEKGGPLDTELVNNEDPREDVFIASLLWTIGVIVSDTRDETGAFRYLRHRPKDVRTTNFPKRFHIPFRAGISQFSNETVALHLKDMDKYVEMEEIIYRTNDLLSGKCDEML